MALRPETSLTVGIATAALVYAVYQMHMPTTADIRASAPNNQAVDSQRAVSTWTAAAAVSVVSLIAHDPTVFVIGGLMVIALDFTSRHANAVSPSTNSVVQASQGSTSAPVGSSGSYNTVTTTQPGSAVSG
jgi:hypothetical protein